MLKLQEQPHHTITVIPDGKFKPVRENLVSLELNPGNFEKSVLISPHRRENRISTDILKFRIYCQKRGIKIISYGGMNQLPFLSLFSDKVFLEKNSKLTALYDNKVQTHNGVIGIPPKCPGVPFVDIEYANVRLQARNEISNQKVAEEFASMNVFIRTSTYELFKKIQDTLPKNCIWAEILKIRKVRNEMTKHDYQMPIIGLDRKFQQDLIKKHGDHFMGLQVLTSLLNNVRFLCGGGSANLFVVVPVLTIAIIEQLLYTDVRDVYRRLAMARYGSIGEILPIMSQKRMPNLPIETWEKVDQGSHFIKIKTAIEEPLKFKSF